MGNSYQGKILIAKERVNLTGVRLIGQTQKVTKDTGSLLPGQAVVCVLDSEPNLPLVILHQELMWRAGSLHFTIASPSEKFSGMSFCFTGPGEYDRAYYKSLVELHEGTYQSGVTRATSYLVAPDLFTISSSKSMRASAIKVPIITYAQFKEMIS